VVRSPWRFRNAGTALHPVNDSPSGGGGKGVTTLADELALADEALRIFYAVAAVVDERATSERVWTPQRVPTVRPTALERRTTSRLPMPQRRPERRPTPRAREHRARRARTGRRARAAPSDQDGESDPDPLGREIAA
jgi:hypothetical protein